MRKLGRNFSALVAALLVGSVVTCGAGLFGLSRLDDSLEAVVSTDMPRLMTVTDLRRRIRTLVVAENDHILERDPVKSKAIEADLANGAKDVGALFTKYEPYLLVEDADTWKALRADFEDWKQLDARVLSLSRARQVDEATALSKTHSKQWESLIKRLISTADKHLQAATTAARGVSATARLALLGVFALSTLLGLIAGLVIYRGIRRTVGEVVSLKDRLVEANEGLELTVAERTRTIRAILDHVQFGFFMVGPELQITDGYTRSLSILLGRDELAGQPAAACLGFTGDRAVDFEMRVRQIFDDFLPESLNCDQIPSRIQRDDRLLRIQASAVRDATGGVVQVLFGISDVTELEAAERANRDNQTLLRALKDPEPFRRFVSDLNARFSSMREAVEASDDPRARRELHTIKGNASCYGLVDLASRAHEIEEHPRIEMPPVVDLEGELETFLKTNRELLGIDGHSAPQEVYRITGDDLGELERMLAGATDLAALRKTLIERLEQVRWQPVGRLLGPLDEQISTLAHRLGKDVALRIVGGDLSVPTSQIAPVLAVVPHMLRNALDHGIEPAGTRGAKPPQATLELGFRDAGDAWLLAVRDDGRGIDTARLRERSVSLGLVAPDATLTDEQVCALIFSPRLSTAQEVTDVSGRGEGMAAVAAAVASCDGKIAVRSRRGAGTTIEIRLPKLPASVEA